MAYHHFANYSYMNPYFYQQVYFQPLAPQYSYPCAEPLPYPAMQPASSVAYSTQGPGSLEPIGKVTTPLIEPFLRVYSYVVSRDGQVFEEPIKHKKLHKIMAELEERDSRKPDLSTLPYYHPSSSLPEEEQEQEVGFQSDVEQQPYASTNENDDTDGSGYRTVYNEKDSNDVTFYKTIVHTVNRNHIHTKRVINNDKRLFTYVTNNIYRINDIHRYRVQNVDGETQVVNEHKRVDNIDPVAKCMIKDERSGSLKSCEDKNEME